jgi:hypothetical protein
MKYRDIDDYPREKVIHLFKVFLKQNNVFNLYEKRTRSCKHLKTFYEITAHSYLLSGAFTWNSTLEGYDFWRKLNDEWRESLNTGSFMLIDLPNSFKLL